MFKSRIAKKLSFYFMISLLVFSLVIGSIFILLFRNHTMNIHKVQLQKRAESISDTLSNFYTNNTSGYGAYMRFVGSISGTDVWIVDENYNLVTTGMGQGGNRYHYNDLPANANELVHEVFNGKTVFSKSFSDLLSEPSLTVGVPIINSNNNEVLGAVLLHAPVEGIDQASEQGVLILGMSMAFALIISITLGVAFSVIFTKPLNKMKQTALQLSKGNYTVNNGIKQKDEIGELALVINQLATRLDLAKHESDRLEEMRKRFVANISHELRTPVTVLRGSLEALCNKVVTQPEKINEYHTQMLSETMFLERLIGDLLDLSRLQSEDFVIEKSEIELSDVLSEVLRSASRLALEKQIEIIAEKPSTNIMISGDYGRLRQMFLIVLDNAIKFTPQNGSIWVEVSNSCIRITDSGNGINPEHLAHIFDRFYKTHGEQNKVGTGLGLAIAKQIALRHDILLTAQNSERKGAIFEFKLPKN